MGRSSNRIAASVVTYLGRGLMKKGGWVCSKRPRLRRITTTSNRVCPFRMSRHPLQIKTTCRHGGSRSTTRRYTWRTVCSLAIRGWRWRFSRRSDWTTSFTNTCPAAAQVLIGQAYVGAYVVLPPSPLPLADEIPIVDVREAGFLKWTLCHREARMSSGHSGLSVASSD